MKITSRYLVAGLLSASFIYAGPVSAQNYPVKPIRIIVPYSPGGSTDVVMRVLAEFCRGAAGFHREDATWHTV